MATHRRPLIAINGLLEPGDIPRLTLKTRYADAVRRAGGLPIVIAPTKDLDEIAALVDRVDGFLLGGGDDFEVERLGLGTTHPLAVPTPPEKQDFDLALARTLLARGVPTLGICYGMQALGLAEGAQLYQHLPEDRPGCQAHADSARHGVRLEAETKLAGLLDVEQLVVVSRHHQALRSVGDRWRVAATDEEGLIEGIERKDHPFALGVQWHPELSPEDPAHGRLFEAFVEAAHSGSKSAPAQTGHPEVVEA